MDDKKGGDARTALPFDSNDTFVAVNGSTDQIFPKKDVISKQPDPLNPNFRMRGRGVVAGQEPQDAFNHGLCTCWSNPRLCAATCFCFPCLGTKIYNSVKKGGSACTCLYFTFCPIAAGCMRREQLKRSYQIKEHPCATCLNITMCAPCAQAQEYLEATYHDDI